jgi:hypothetical protein
MPRVEFEPMIPIVVRAKTVHALDHAATVVSALTIRHSVCSCWYNNRIILQVTQRRE